MQATLLSHPPRTETDLFVPFVLFATVFHQRQLAPTTHSSYFSPSPAPPATPLPPPPLMALSIVLVQPSLSFVPDAVRGVAI